MLIECRTCVMERTETCDDCVVSYVISVDREMELSKPEEAALGHLADAGLIPRLRLVTNGSTDNDPPPKIQQTG